MHDRRTFLTLAAAAPAATATSATASTPGAITVPIGPFANNEEPEMNTKRVKSEQMIDGQRVKIEVSYVCQKMTQITLYKPG